MKRNALELLMAMSLVVVASPVLADEAQPELQPTRVESGWFKRPVDATTYEAKQGSGEVKDYRFLTDFSSL